MKKLLGLVLVVFAFPAFAADINYNFVQAGYQQVDIDGASEDADGFALSGSFEVGENVFVSAGYGRLEWDDFGFDTEVDTISVGVGYHVPVSDTMDFYGSLSAIQVDASIAGLGSGDDNGFGATIGLRSMVGDNVELTGSIGYADVGDFGDDTTVGVGALYNFTENFSVGLFLEFADDATGYGGGIRLYW